MKLGISYKTIAELRAFTAQDVKLNKNVYVTDTDKEGEFVLDSTDTTSSDNLGTILVTNSGARYKRRYSKELNVRWFGAVGDGSANDTNALSTAITLAINNSEVCVFNTGEYKVFGNLYNNLSVNGNKNVNLKFVGEVKITVDSSVTEIDLHLIRFAHNNTSNVSVFGDTCIVNLNNKCKGFIRVGNYGFDGATPYVLKGGNCSINLNNLTILNTYVENVINTSGDNAASALWVNGTFDKINIQNVTVNSVTRSAGLSGQSYWGDCKGILVNNVLGEVSVSGCTVKNVLSHVNFDANADGIAIFGIGSPTSNIARKGKAVVFNNYIEDCQTRGVKIQTSNAAVFSNDFKRNLVVSSPNSREIDFQYGNGRAYDNVITFKKNGATSPLDQYHASIRWCAILEDEEMYGIAENNTFYTDVVIPYPFFINYRDGLSIAVERSTYDVINNHIINTDDFTTTGCIGKSFVEFDAYYLNLHETQARINIIDNSYFSSAQPLLGYNSAPADTNLGDKLVFTLENNRNTNLALVPLLFSYSSGGVDIIKVNRFKIFNNSGFSDRLSTVWIVDFNNLKIMPHSEFVVDLSTNTIANGKLLNAPSGIPTTDYAFVKVVNEWVGWSFIEIYVHGTTALYQYKWNGASWKSYIIEDGLSVNTNPFKTLSDIRSFTAVEVSKFPNVYMTDEGKTGYWKYDASDTTSTDNTGTIVVTLNGARYKRVFDKSVKPEWFGAKINDSSFNSGAAINLAIQASNKILLSTGTYYSSEKILINKNDFILEGEGKFNTVIQTKSGFSGSALVAVGSAAMQPYDVTVKNLRINANASGTGTNVSALEIDAQYNIDIDNCWMQGGDYNGTLTASANVKLSKHLRFTSCNFTNGVSYGVMFSGTAYDDTMFNDCQFDENQVDIIVLSTGYLQRGNILGCSFGQSYVNGTYPTPIVNKNIYAGTASTIDYLSVINCDFFSSTGSNTDNAIDITSPIQIRVESSRFSNLKKYAIVSRDSGKLIVSNNSFINNGRSRANSTYTNATTNPDTSPYMTDVFSTSAFYGGIISNNITDQTVVACVEIGGSTLTDQNFIFNNNLVYSFGELWGAANRNIGGVELNLRTNGSASNFLNEQGNYVSISGGGDALTSNPLSQFAATTSAQLAGVISDETGTGSLVFANSPTLVTPVLGVASVTSINKLSITAPATGSTLSIADGKTLTASNTLTFTGTDSSSIAFGGGGTVLYSGGALGTPSSITLTNGTGLPISTGVSGLGTGIATFLTTPSSANLISAVTDETGTGNLVFSTSPTLVTPNLGTPSAIVLTNATGVPAGQLTGIIPTGVLGNSSLNIGTTSIALNRASASQALTGITSIDGFAAAVTLTADNTTNATNYPLFVNAATGNLSPRTDTGFTYNPSTGVLTSTTFAGALSGNATTATTLQTGRTINGTTFDGSTNITITAAAGTLTGTTLNATVTGSSLTSVGTITSGTWSGSFGAVSGANLTNLTAANLTGTIPSAVLGNSSHFIGTTSITLNRASANQALTGILSVQLAGATSGTTTIQPSAVAGTTTITFPAVTGTVITTGDTSTVTNTMLAGSITNAKLANSTISGIALGSNLNALTIGTGLTGTSYNGSGAVSIAIDSTVVTLSGSQTLTNKTLTNPVISSISNSGTITIPTGTDTIVGRATTDTLTNKRITARVQSTTSTATFTFNFDSDDIGVITAQAAGLTVTTSGTPTSMQPFVLCVKDNGTARAITWNGIFVAIGVTLPTTTVVNKHTYVSGYYNTTAAKVHIVGVTTEA